MKTRSYVSLRSRALRSAASASRAAHLGAALGRCRAPPDSPRSDARRARVALDEHGPLRRPARAPRCRARRCRRTGRARCAPVDVAEHREQRLAHAVGGRPRRPAPRRLQAPAAEASRDHPHRPHRSPSAAPRRRGRAGLRRDRLERLGAEPPLERVGRAARARAPAARGRPRRSPRAQRPRALEQLGVLGQARDLELRRSRTGACRPARPPCAARGRSRPGGSRRRARPARAAAPSRAPAGRPGSSCARCSPRPTRPRSWCSWEIPKRSAFSISITVALGTSMPTSITVVATSTSACPEANAAIASCFSRGRMPPCSSASSIARAARPRAGARARRWRRAARACGLARADRGAAPAPCRRLGLLDQRADDVRLAPGAQLARAARS